MGETAFLLFSAAILSRCGNGVTERPCDRLPPRLKISLGRSLEAGLVLRPPFLAFVNFEFVCLTSRPLRPQSPITYRVEITSLAASFTLFHGVRFGGGRIEFSSSMVILLELSEDGMVRRMPDPPNYGSFREWCRHW